jgi:hypothetical protein
MGNTHVVLLGDRSLENGSYAGGTGNGVSLTDAFRMKLSEDVTLLATEGAKLSELRTQAMSAPKTGTHFIVSIGGHCIYEANELVHSVDQNGVQMIQALYQFIYKFEVAYSNAITTLIDIVGSEKAVILCTYCSPCAGPDSDSFRSSIVPETVHLIVSMLADAIMRVGVGIGAPVVDVRRILTREEDFSSPSRPSVVGGQKLAELLVEVVTKHQFPEKKSIVYPLNCSDLTVLNFPSSLFPAAQVQSQPFTDPTWSTPSVSLERSRSPSKSLRSKNPDRREFSQRLEKLAQDYSTVTLELKRKDAELKAKDEQLKLKDIELKDRAKDLKRQTEAEEERDKIREQVLKQKDADIALLKQDYSKQGERLVALAGEMNSHRLLLATAPPTSVESYRVSMEKQRKEIEELQRETARLRTEAAEAHLARQSTAGLLSGGNQKMLSNLDAKCKLLQMANAQLEVRSLARFRPNIFIFLALSGIAGAGTCGACRQHRQAAGRAERLRAPAVRGV